MWNQSNGQWVCTFEFQDFFKAVAFIEKISLLCDSLQHLPQWKDSLHRVRITVKHEKEGRAESAYELQQKIENIYAHI